jgi:hypothetical protein
VRRSTARARSSWPVHASEPAGPALRLQTLGLACRSQAVHASRGRRTLRDRRGRRPRSWPGCYTRNITRGVVLAPTSDPGSHPNE